LIRQKAAEKGQG